MENVVFIVEREARRKKASEIGIRVDETLLGLYEGVPKTGRGINYSGVLPEWLTGKDLILHTIGDIGVDGARYLERASIHTAANVIKAKKAIKKAFQYQIEGKGFSLVEVLSTCPTNMGISPLEAAKFVNDRMLPHYPLGVFKDIAGGKTDVSRN